MLEGVGILEKTSKNEIQWATSGSPEQAEERGQLEEDIAELKVGAQEGREQGQGLLLRAGGKGDHVGSNSQCGQTSEVLGV